MAGVLLDDASCGCPPTETPPVDYVNPVRFSDDGCMWITGCFTGFQYFGAARHDIGTSGVLGGTGYPVDSGDLTVPVTAGTYEDLTITNDTTCTIGVLLAYDMFVDIQARADHLVKWIVAGKWEGAVHSINACSSIRIDGSSDLVRYQAGASANPHDVSIEAGTGPSLTLAPGASATVSAQLFLQYVLGSATGDEAVFSSYSAVRAYGYVIP